MMMQPFSGLGMWVWEADKNDPQAFCSRLASHNYSWVVVKAHDGGSAFNTGAQIDAWKAACRRHGLRFGIWGYVYRGSDARMAVQAVQRFGPDFYVADAEHEIEVASGPESLIFCEIFRRALPDRPAAMSSFGRIDFHAIDWKAWHDHGFDFMPQAYECESSALAPDLCVGVAEHVWKRNRIYPTLGSYQGARGIWSGQQLHDSVIHIALPGVNLWDAQELHGDQLEKLGELAHRSRPPVVPPTKKPPVIHRGPWRDLHLTSPTMRGNDVKLLQQGINHRLQARGQHGIAVDGDFGPATLHGTGIAAYDLGIVDSHATVANQHKIEDPRRLNPNEIRRMHQRDKARAEAKKHTGGHMGIGAIPHIAARFIGVAENPAGSNTGHPHPTDWEERFGMNGVPWCGCFAGSMVMLAGGHVTSRVAFCPSIEADAKAGVNGFDRWVPNHDQGVGPGWLVLYCWDSSGVPEHVGVVESIHSDHLVAIEGNTGGRNPADGGEVARVSRNYGPTVGYARPRL